MDIKTILTASVILLIMSGCSEEKPEKSKSEYKALMCAEFGKVLDAETGDCKRPAATKH